MPDDEEKEEAKGNSAASGRRQLTYWNSTFPSEHWRVKRQASSRPSSQLLLPLPQTKEAQTKLNDNKQKAAEAFQGDDQRRQDERGRNKQRASKPAPTTNENQLTAPWCASSNCEFANEITGPHLVPFYRDSRRQTTTTTIGGPGLARKLPAGEEIHKKSSLVSDLR